MKKIILVAALAVLAVALAGATSLGIVFRPDKATTLPTCGVVYEGGIVQMNGDAGTGYTKLCYCVSDGAATPAYQWCSTAFGAGVALTTCAGGSTTVCP